MRSDSFNLTPTMFGVAPLSTLPGARSTITVAMAREFWIVISENSKVSGRTGSLKVSISLSMSRLR